MFRVAVVAVQITPAGLYLVILVFIVFWIGTLPSSGCDLDVRTRTMEVSLYRLTLFRLVVLLCFLVFVRRIW
jgi:hypothetical protein